MTQPQFAVRASAPKALADGTKSVAIDVYDVIGGEWGGVSAESIYRALSVRGLSEVDVTIHSVGGNALDGIAIYNALRQSGALIRVNVHGLAASAASVIAVAGDEIRIAKNGFLMIHEAWNVVGGRADDLDGAATVLRSLNAGIARTYEDAAKRRDKEVSAEHFLELMAAETWLSAGEAIELGLADTIAEPVKAAASVDLSGFRRPPPVSSLSRGEKIQTAEHAAIHKGNEMKNLANALHLPESATESDVLCAVQVLASEKARLLAALSVASVDAAIGAIEAGKAAAQTAEALQAKLTDAQAKSEADEASALLEKLRAESRITPAQEGELWNSLGIDGKRAFAKSAPKISSPSRAAAPAPGNSPGAKAFEQLTPMERHSLHASDPETYNALREDAVSRSAL